MTTLDYQTVGLLATGTELTQGDILNTNGQAIAHQLKDYGFEMGMHIIVADDESEIETALSFLLNHYNAVIITGGLGPTSDDRTRYALSKVINQPLVFHEPSWQRVVARLEGFGIKVHESNRQQALFPENAQVLPNDNGTAAGCIINAEGKLIYMLPGPPIECLPMFQQGVLPHLMQYQKTKELLNYKWLLFGVIEADIAAQLDDLVRAYSAVTGYRLRSPYLEFKLQISPHPNLTQLLTAIENILAPYWFNTKNFTASELLQQKLNHFAVPIIIHDTATGGLLEASLTTPSTKKFLRFNGSKNIPAQVLYIQIQGLQEFWEEHNHTNTTQLKITFNYQDQEQTVSSLLPYRPKYILSYAVEYICQRILDFLNTL